MGSSTEQVLTVKQLSTARSRKLNNSMADEAASHGKIVTADSVSARRGVRG